MSDNLNYMTRLKALSKQFEKKRDTREGSGKTPRTPCMAMTKTPFQLPITSADLFTHGFNRAIAVWKAGDTVEFLLQIEQSKENPHADLGRLAACNLILGRISESESVTKKYLADWQEFLQSASDNLDAYIKNRFK